MRTYFVRTLAVLSLGLVSFCFSFCNYDDNVSGLHYLLDMHDSIAVEAQEEDFTNRQEKEEGVWQRGMNDSPAFGGPGSSLRVPPEGSVPRNYEPYPYGAADFAAAGRELKNLLPKTKKVYERGQKQYNTFCAVCHGYTGLGDGPVTPRLAEVPSLMSPQIRSWKDGEFYHIITMGRGRMLPYSAQILPEDRWAIIHYIRLLQAQPIKVLQKGGAAAK